VNTKVLRALAARAYKLVRSDIPSQKLEIDYAVLEQITQDEAELPRILGITEASNPNMTHPYCLTDVSEQLGYSGWSRAQKLLARIRSEKGVDLKSTDNMYHIKMKTGRSERSRTGKYSKALVALLKRVDEGKEYEVRL
jgi:hypothetical protein